MEINDVTEGGGSSGSGDHHRRIMCEYEIRETDYFMQVEEGKMIQ